MALAVRRYRSLISTIDRLKDISSPTKVVLGEFESAQTYYERNFVARTMKEKGASRTQQSVAREL